MLVQKGISKEGMQRLAAFDKEAQDSYEQELHEALIGAINSKDLQRIQFLVETEGVPLDLNSGEALNTAYLGGHTEILQYLIDNGASERFLASRSAQMAGDVSLSDAMRSLGEGMDPLVENLYNVLPDLEAGTRLDDAYTKFLAEVRQIVSPMNMDEEF